MAALRMALLTLRLVMRTRTALFFTFLFPVIFLLVYAGLFARGNPQAVAYMFGPVVTLNVMGSGFWGLGLQSVMQRERGSLRRYRLAPIGPGSVVVSNLLANYFLQLPTIGLLVFCAVVFFHMPLKIGWVTLLILVTAGNFAFAGFGLTIASLANTMQEAQIYNNLVWLTLLFLSGTTVPLALLPHWVQRLAAFLPATYLVTSFQGVMMQMRPLSDYWREMQVLILSGLFGVLFAWKLFRWEKEEKIPARRKLWSLAFLFPFLLMGVWMNARANPGASWALTYRLMERGVAGSSDSPSRSTENLIDGFEDSQSPRDLLRHWQVPANLGGSGLTLVELSLASPGAAGTEHALRLRGTIAAGGRTASDIWEAPSTSAGPKIHRGDEDVTVASRSVAPPPQDQGLSGIEFWLRGDSRLYRISLRNPAAPAASTIGVTLIPTDQWQRVRLPVAWLSIPSNSAPSKLLWTLEIALAGPQGEFRLDIDEIRFY